MKNFLRQGFAKKVVLFAFLIGMVSPSAMAYVATGFPVGTAPVTTLVAAVAPVVQNLNVTTSTGSATVSFSLNTNATTTVWIKDASDTIVRTLAFDNNLAGSTPYTFTWNGLDNNGAAVSAGSYKAQVVAYNTVSSDIKSFTFNYTTGSVVTAPVVSVSVSPTSFDPTTGGSTTVTYTLNTTANLSVLVKFNGSTVRTLRALASQTAGTYSLPWNGLNDAGSTLGANAYTVEVFATNASGSDTKTATATITTTPVVTAPVVSVSVSPTSFDPTTGGNTTVTYTLNTTANLSVLVKFNGSTVRTLRSLASQTAGSYSLVWNGLNDAGSTLGANAYTVEVFATNASGSDTKVATATITSTNNTSAPQITSMYATPNPFNPNSQNTSIYFTLDKSATVSLNVLTGSNTRNLLNAASLSAGTYFYQWNGRDGLGSLVADGTYTATVTASNTAGTNTQSTNVQVNTGSSTCGSSIVTSSYVNNNSFNPNNTSAQIFYTLSRAATVTVTIENNSSSTIRTLVNSQSQGVGQQVVAWNGLDYNGNMVANGTYWYQINATANGCTDTASFGSMTVTNSGNGGNYVNDWASTDENLIQNVTVTNEVFRPRNAELTTVNFDLTRSARLNVQVLDGTTVVRTLRDVSSQSSGSYSYSWDGRDTNGNIMRDAVYTFRVMADDGRYTDTDRASTELDTDGVIIGFPTDSRCAGYVDVSINSPFCKAIQLMSTKHIFQGYPDGTFRPYEYINRAETAKVVVLALGYSVNTSGYFGRQYTDTTANAWYAPYLDVAKKYDIATGYPDGSFHPGSTINRVELLRVFLEANHLNLSDCSVQPFSDTPINASTQWYMKYACYAKDNGLMGSQNSNKLFPAMAMTRGDVANLFYDFDQKGLYNTYNNNGYNYNNQVCLSYNSNGTCAQYSTTSNSNQYCLSYNSNGTCAQYSNSTNPTNQVCVARDSLGHCTSWAYDNSYCTSYDANGNCLNYSGSNYNNSTNGYYVYQNGRYVWIAY